MKSRSRKNKGKKLENYVGKAIADAIGEKYGRYEMVRPAFGGEPGRDVILIGIASEKYPFSVECKNQEKWNLPVYIEQAIKNCQPGTDYQVIISKNRFEPHVIMRLDVWLDYWKQYCEFVWR